jgi:hypothetical protein
VFAVIGADGKTALDRWIQWARRSRIPAFIALQRRNHHPPRRDRRRARHRPLARACRINEHQDPTPHSHRLRLPPIRSTRRARDARPRLTSTAPPLGHSRPGSWGHPYPLSIGRGRPSTETAQVRTVIGARFGNTGSCRGDAKVSIRRFVVASARQWSCSVGVLRRPYRPVRCLASAPRAERSLSIRSPRDLLLTASRPAWGWVRCCEVLQQRHLVRCWGVTAESKRCASLVRWSGSDQRSNPSRTFSSLALRSC